MLEQALTQVSKIPVGMSCRSNPFVDLRQMHVSPGNLLSGQGTEHDPRGVPATDGHDKAPPFGDCRASLGSDDCGSLSSHRVGICENFNLHENVSIAISPAHRLMSLMCLTFHNRVLPASNRHNFLVRFARSPGIRIVLTDGGSRL